MPELTANAGIVAPPDDPVRAALDDPAGRARLAAAARAMVRGRPVDADDVVQEACQRAWEKRDGYDPDKATAAAWLNGIVRNVAREKLRALGVAQTPDGGAWDSIVAPNHEDGVNLEEARALLGRLLATLPGHLRDAVEMRHLRDMEYADIAAALGVSGDAARQRVCRGMNQLTALAAQEGRS